MNYYLISFLVGAFISLLICKNFYFFRKNQNAHIFSKMLNEAIKDIGYKHDSKKGDALLNAIHNELVPSMEFLKKHRDFLPKELKKWFQKSVAHSDRSHDYLDRYISMQICEDSMHCNLQCRGLKSYSYISLLDLVIELLHAHDRYGWDKKLFYNTS